MVEELRVRMELPDADMPDGWKKKTTKTIRRRDYFVNRSARPLLMRLWAVDASGGFVCFRSVHFLRQCLAKSRSATSLPPAPVCVYRFLSPPPCPARQ